MKTASRQALRLGSFTYGVLIGNSKFPISRIYVTSVIDLYVWVSTTTLLCSIFLPVLVKAIPCIGKDLGMSTVEYASLMVELQQDAYTSKTRESHIFEGNRADRFVRLGANHYLVVLYFPASACQSHLGPHVEVRTWECLL